ncbi:MAG: hypothetical protein KDB68_09650 [Planctomycetes bacterium]|nr:hypothetical protein [Planctomycetota bacterium]
MRSAPASLLYGVPVKLRCPSHARTAMLNQFSPSTVHRLLNALNDIGLPEWVRFGWNNTYAPKEPPTNSCIASNLHNVRGFLLNDIKRSCA